MNKLRIFLSLCTLSPPSLSNPLTIRQICLFGSSWSLRSNNHLLASPDRKLEASMVSIRRRKLLGLCSGRNSFLAPLSRFFDYANALENPVQNTKPVFVHQPKSVHPVPSVDADQPKEKTISKVVPGSSIVSGSSSSKEQQNQLFPVQEVKRRKRHRRKHFENQEQCVMRGVYFKNMKWQAAIKVDKKQIHLGTVGSQEEAAHLYDRAAFMCGREPNFELSEEEKQELRKFNWEEFLAMTRYAITSKKHQRRSREGSRRKYEFPTRNSEWEGEQEINGFSASEDVEPDISVS